MPDYPAMYRKLFNAATDAANLVEEALEIIKQAQRETEEMYISAPDPDIRLLDTNKQMDDADSAGQE